MSKLNYGAMLNAYPDSIGGKLSDITKLLSSDSLSGAFTSFYILPSLFHTDLDRGFSVQDYGLEESLATKEDLAALKNAGLDLKLDFILNHASVLSPQFQDILKNGENSKYCDFFIDWNKFWDGHGKMNDSGYIEPDPEIIKDMFFRKPGLPILMVRFPNGRDVPYWNTFYQEVWEENGERKYLGQMDLNIKSPLVWDFYKDTLNTLAGYGASIVRLDAFAYAPKEVGARNFLNEPGTWELLQKIDDIATPLGITLLPEIHASYAEGTYRTIAKKGYMVYDFFLPGLILDAFEERSGKALAKWAQEIIDNNITTVNMLGCHDGIPLLDLKGLLPEEQIQNIINTVVGRGGYVKDLHGAKNVYYQVNATYYSALGEDDRRMLLARAVQLFMPGKPQVWYLDLFAGKNDFDAMRRAGVGGHKEINRTNLSLDDANEKLSLPIVQNQIELLRMRNSYKVFSPDAKKSVEFDGSRFTLRWEKDSEIAKLNADFATGAFEITITDTLTGDTKYSYLQE
jgi:sucrose phosphorylase